MGRFLGNTFDTATARTDPGRATLTRSDTVIADNLRHSATRRHASRSPTRATRDTTDTTGGSQANIFVACEEHLVHNGSGGCTAIPSKTIGAARAAHNRTNSHGMRISHARRGQAVLQFEQTYLALQRQHGPVPCHATCNMGGGCIGLRQRACTCNLSPAAAPPPVGLSRYPPSAISAGLWHASAFLVRHLLSMAS